MGLVCNVHCAPISVIQNHLIDCILLLPCITIKRDPINPINMGLRASYLRQGRLVKYCHWVPMLFGLTLIYKIWLTSSGLKSKVGIKADFCWKASGSGFGSCSTFGSGFGLGWVNILEIVLINSWVWNLLVVISLNLSERMLRIFLKNKSRINSRNTFIFQYDIIRFKGSLWGLYMGYGRKHLGYPLSWFPFPISSVDPIFSTH